LFSLECTTGDAALIDLECATSAASQGEFRRNGASPAFPLIFTGDFRGAADRTIAVARAVTPCHADHNRG